MTSAPVTISRHSLMLGNPVALFRTTSYAFPSNLRTYDASADGQKFLMLKEAGDRSASAATMVIVLNWLDELKSRFDTEK